MKNKSTSLVLFLTFFSIFSVISYSATAIPKYAVGTTVCAKWSSSWYEAVITGIAGAKYNVKYGDGATGTVTEAEIKLPSKKNEVKIGDKVLAVWTSVRYYEGTVNAVTADGCIVKWNDGSTPSLAKWGKVVKL
jgi:hypothetical protein